MSDILSTINSAIKRAPLLSGFFFAAVLALESISARAQCAQWDAGGQWELQQSNGFSLTMDLVQSGTTITGKASEGRVTSGTKVLGLKVEGGDPDIRTYRVTGNIEGNDFYVMIGTAGIYRGTVGPSGRIDGTTYDRNAPTNKASWFSGRAMKCSPEPGSPASPAPPKVITRSGRRPTTPTPAAEPLKPPFISAGPVIAPPNLPFASVYLGWDAGADHPNAEVWVSINNQPEIPVQDGPAFKEPKIAAIEVRLNRALRGQYRYLLKDGAATLSTVVVVVP